MDNKPNKQTPDPEAYGAGGYSTEPVKKTPDLMKKPRRDKDVLLIRLTVVILVIAVVMSAISYLQP